MILVTGAAGKTGRAVLNHLAEKNVRVRALIHKPDYAEAVRALDVDEIMDGDMRNPDLIRSALKGVHSVYHIPPNMHPDELEIGKQIISEACNEKVSHFVYHSVLHPHVEAMPHHWQKMRVEEFIFESGLEYTILQPTAYVQNILGQWRQIAEKCIFQMPYPVETCLSLVDLQDVAYVAAMVLTQAGHNGAIYELVGTEPLSQIEVAELLGEILAKEVHADTISIEAWSTDARDAGLGTYAIETLGKMFHYYAAHGFGGNPNVLKWLLGRSPTGIKETVTRELKSAS